jgi:hypothetical protein
LKNTVFIIDIAAIIGGDVGLMVRAFSAALEDDNLLVRRSTLDLLLQSVRLDGSVIKRAQAEDRIILMGAATGVVLRRDSALNRRLYTWLLGTAEDSDSQIQYLKSNSLDLLCTTLKVMVLQLVFGSKKTDTVLCLKERTFYFEYYSRCQTTQDISFSS